LDRIFEFLKVFLTPMAEVVNPTDLVAARDKCVSNVRSDKSGHSGNEITRHSSVKILYRLLFARNLSKRPNFSWHFALTLLRETTRNLDVDSLPAASNASSWADSARSRGGAGNLIF